MIKDKERKKMECEILLQLTCQPIYILNRFDITEIQVKYVGSKCILKISPFPCSIKKLFLSLLLEVLGFEQQIFLRFFTKLGEIFFLIFVIILKFDKSKKKNKIKTEYDN